MLCKIDNDKCTNKSIIKFFLPVTVLRKHDTITLLILLFQALTNNVYNKLSLGLLFFFTKQLCFKLFSRKIMLKMSQIYYTAISMSHVVHKMAVP